MRLKKEGDMVRTAHQKYISPDLYESAAIYLLADCEPELFNEMGRITFAFLYTPEVREAADKFRNREKVDIYLFTMLLKKLRGRMIEAKDQLRRERGGGEYAGNHRTY
jgi:hypothetical protein